MFLPPSRNSALLFCPFHQKKNPMRSETRSMRPKMTYSSTPNLAINWSRVKRCCRTPSSMTLETFDALIFCLEKNQDTSSYKSIWRIVFTRSADFQTLKNGEVRYVIAAMRLFFPSLCATQKH